jgi:hypothetical protein
MVTFRGVFVDGQVDAEFGTAGAAVDVDQPAVVGDDFGD